MRTKQMHDGQIPSDADLVLRLVRAQFPQWAELSVEPVDSDGTANAIYRLGDDLAVRMPLQLSAAKIAQIDKELRWLPEFAPRLPLAIPVPLKKGEPAEGYPAPWVVCQWIEGENPTLDSLTDTVADAQSLGRFLLALQEIDPSSGPAPGAHNFFRGVPLVQRDESMQEQLKNCEGLVDVDAVGVAWARDRDAPTWDRDPAWVHGDLAPGNLLAKDGRLTAVIDWGGLGVGDPSVELLPAWNLFAGESRAAFREALAVDEATWARGRGMALSHAIIALGYYQKTNPAIVRWAHDITDAVMADHAREG